MAKLTQKLRGYTTDLLAEALQKANRIAPVRAARVIQETYAHGFDPQLELDAERKDANIAVAVRVITGAVSGLPIKIKEMTINQGKLALIDADDHPAMELFNTPNPFNPPTDIKAHAVQSLVLCGNAIFSLEKERSAQPNELWPLEFPLVEIKRTPRGVPETYVYQPRMEAVPFDASEICHMRLYHCLNTFYGRSGIEPIKGNVMSDLYAENTLRKFWKRGAVLDGIFWPEQDMLEDQQEALLKQINQKTSGVDKFFGFFLSPFKGRFEQVQPVIKDLMFDAMLKINREKVYAVLGIPPSVGGVYEFANYANAAIQRKTYWEDTIIPLLTVIEEAWTRQILWRHFDTDHVVKFDLSHVPALKDDELVKANTHSIYVRSGILTANEVRTELGRESLEGGDELVGQISLQDILNAQSQSAPGNKPSEEDGAREPGDDGKAAQNRALVPVRLKSSPLDYRTRHWKKWNSRKTQHELAFARVMAGYFKAQSKRVTARVEDITQKGAFMANLLFAYKANPTPDDADFIFNMDSETSSLGETVKPEFKRTIREAFKQTAGDIGLDLSFNVNNPEVQYAIDSAWSRIKDINATSFDEIKDMLRSAYDEGWGIDKLKREIRSMYSQWSSGTSVTQARALTIAKTEMAGVVNAGNANAYQTAGYEAMEWLVAPGAQHPRHENMAGLDGQRVRIGESFLVDGEFLKYPGDWSGSPGNVINCNCTTIGVATFED